MSLRDPLAALSNPLVRDLAGMMSAPVLLAGGPSAPLVGDEDCARELELRWPRLLELDRDPSPLEAWLERSQGTPLLGRYFEALAGYWIRELMGVRRLETAVHVLRGRAVVGELDFVFEDAAARLRHWEVAVKFYLCVAAEPSGALDASAFLGTMTKDRLDLKMRKILDRQLARAHEPEGRAALRSVGFEGAPESRAFVKGALFYPAERGWRDWPHPPEVSPSHLRGWWSGGLPSGRGAESRWVELDKRRWLSRFLGEPGFEPLTRAAMEARAAAHFAEFRTALMVAEVRRRPEGGLWAEHERGLLVHEGWPWPVRP